MESKTEDKIDIQVYTKLVKLDSKIGTTASKQLFWCLRFTTRSDIIEVLIFVLNLHFKMIQGHRSRTRERPCTVGKGWIRWVRTHLPAAMLPKIRGR